MLDPEVFTRLPALAITTSRLPDQARNHRANRIIAAITGAFCLGDSQLHEFLFWFVGRRNHADGLYLFIARVSYEPQISRFRNLNANGKPKPRIPASICISVEVSRMPAKSARFRCMHSAQHGGTGYCLAPVGCRSKAISRPPSPFAARFSRFDLGSCFPSLFPVQICDRNLVSP